MAKQKQKKTRTGAYQLSKQRSLGMLHPGAQNMFLRLSIFYRCQLSALRLPLFLFCVLASLSLLELDSPHTAGQIVSGNPTPVFFFSSAKLQDSYWLSLSHMICPEPIIVYQGMWCCDRQKTESWALLVVGQGIIGISNGLAEWGMRCSKESRENGKVCWPVHCTLLECLLKSCLPWFSLWL